MNDAGYYRFPTIHAETIVFVCEDDLWSVHVSGGVARRLTAGRGECSLPRFSPNGELIAFVGREEWHPEVHVMPAAGGIAKRLTYLGADVCTVCAWTPDGAEILISSEAGSPFVRHTEAFAIPYEGGAARNLGLGHVATLSMQAPNRIVIGRNTNDPARWKRYRGGTAGDIWIDATGGGQFRRLLTVKGNVAWPMFVGDRVCFVSDHEGVGNIYSCAFDGSDLHRHTDHADYFVRFPSTDGKRIVYTAGAHLFVVDPAKDSTSRVDAIAPSSPAQLGRRYVEAAAFLEHFALHPAGHSLALIARGQPYTLANWEDGVTDHGVGSKVRYRLAEWLASGDRLAIVDDADGQERINLHSVDQHAAPERAADSDLGRIIELATSPTGKVIAIANHRYELVLIDIESKSVRVVDRSADARIGDLAFSPDGRWIAYRWNATHDASIIRIVDVDAGTVHDVTRPLRMDTTPSFDPDGKYLYFLSTRDFNPVYDALQFDLGFPHAMRPFLVTLRADVTSPFVPSLRPVVKRKADDKREEPQTTAPHSPIDIDFDGIADRIVGFPVEEGRYEQIVAAKGRAIYTKYPVRGSLDPPWYDLDEPTEGTLYAYDFDEQQQITMAFDVGSIRLAADHRTLAYRSGKHLRVIDALDRSGEHGERRRAPREAGRRSGWIDLARVTSLVEPIDEWRQMYREAWRLQREQFWDDQMTQVDWQLVHDRYARLVPHLRTRGELSDLIWEMQGELGTSHAYEMGGDYRKPPPYRRGFLGADLRWDPAAAGYRITRIYRGDSWSRDADSPLAEPGLGIAVGDTIVGVGGHDVSATVSPDELLVNEAGRTVVLSIVGAQDHGERRRVAVTTLKDEHGLRYRAWVNGNRQYVRERCGGRVGYIHIPDMGPWGFAEFHRGYLSEFNLEGLIVDVRFNRGGHVSPLLLEKLGRKRVGYDVSRWGAPEPYPPESVRGPMVGLTNQFAGSDGDIFSHCFKLYKLGPLIGKRTWGGVIGIWPRHPLVDGTVTTQPEFSFWFTDVGWRVENYGTDPDIDVDIAPHDSLAGRDPQLDRGIELILSALETKSVPLPDFGPRPSLAIPTKLPPRK